MTYTLIKAFHSYRRYVTRKSKSFNLLISIGVNGWLWKTGWLDPGARSDLPSSRRIDADKLDNWYCTVATTNLYLLVHYLTLRRLLRGTDSQTGRRRESETIFFSCFLRRQYFPLRLSFFPLIILISCSLPKLSLANNTERILLSYVPALRIKIDRK